MPSSTPPWTCPWTSSGLVRHAPHGELTVGQHEVGGRCLEQVGRDLVRLLAHLRRIAEGVHAAARGRAATKGADAVPDQRRVALDHLDHLHGDLQLVFYFFQAEDGIRVLYVTGVQTCALPI